MRRKYSALSTPERASGEAVEGVAEGPELEAAVEGAI